MPFDVDLPLGINQEDALSYLISYLRNEVKATHTHQGYILNVTDVVNKYLEKDRQKIKKLTFGNDFI